MIDAAAICPVCGDTGIPIVFGLPDAELRHAEERGEVALGGCVVSEGDPDHQCGSCGHEWRAKVAKQLGERSKR